MTRALRRAAGQVFGMPTFNLAGFGEKYYRKLKIAQNMTTQPEFSFRRRIDVAS